MSNQRWFAVGSMLFALAAFTGCGNSAEPTTDEAAHAEHAAHEHAGHDHGAETEHMHGAWWCNEHGVPEEVCALCDPKLVSDFKSKGDWCKMHERPGSQCFVCHPEREAEFAAQYEAKYGKQPPKPAS